MLMWSTWLMAVISAYRAGGDLWDNPRYRAGFAAFQLILAAWAFFQQQAWLLAWYLPRYTAVPWSAGRVEWKVLGGLVTGGMYWLWDWLQTRSRKKDRGANP